MRQKPTLADLEVLLPLRARIQQLKVAFYKTLNYYEPEFMSGPCDWEFDFFQNLLGANFSHWRFAFLIYKKRDRAANFDAVKGFLHDLMEDNTISFAREVTHQSWMGGYYGNNGRHRIIRMVSKIRRKFPDGADEILSRIEGAAGFEDTVEPMYGTDQRDGQAIKPGDSIAALELQMAVVDALFGWLTAHLEKKKAALQP